MLRRTLLLLAAVAAANCAPYVWNISSPESEHFSLCLGERPSDELRRSLLMCRGLAYEFCVNSSLVGSVLKSEEITKAHFKEVALAPTIKNLERLTWLIDSSLTMLYDTFTTHRPAQPECVHEWKAWVCSRAFRRATNSSVHPLSVCMETCKRVEDACDVNMNCAGAIPSRKECTDFYKDSGGELCKHSGAGAVKLSARSVPVFKHRRSDSMPSAATKLQKQWILMLCYILLIWSYL